MFFSDGIILKCPPTGECEIDVELIKKEWHDGAYIDCQEKYDSQLDLYIPEFKLIETTPDPEAYKGRRIKITIKPADAIQLIRDLKLKANRHTFFIRSITYRK